MNNYESQGGESTIGLTSESNAPQALLDLFWLVLFLVVVFIVLAVGRKMLTNFLVRRRFIDHVLYKIRLPKEKPKDNEREVTVQMMREEIARAEMIFGAIGGLRAQKGLWHWLVGRYDQFSYEIVASNKQISFYAVAPRKAARYIEQQVQAHYPDAVMEPEVDYNIFKASSVIRASYVATKRSFIYPLRTFNKMETDAMSSLINAMSKLRQDESIAVQYLVRSAHPRWHRRISRIFRLIRKGKPLHEALRQTGQLTVLRFFMDFFSVAFNSKQHELDKQKQQGNMMKQTQADEQILKGFEEKNGKAGLDVNIRVVVATASEMQAGMLLDNVISSFSQCNLYEYGNQFNRGAQSYKRLIDDFIYRRFHEKTSSLLNTEELATIFHLPLKWLETPNIAWLTAKYAPAPTNVPNEGILLGYNEYRGERKEIRFKRDDRRRHTYIIGKSGVGKSVLQANMIIQDILNGEGVCVIDPHGDLVQDVLERIPPERAEDVIFFAPQDTERPLALNLLEFDPKYPEQKTFAINEMIKIFDKLYDLKATGGPIFEQYMRNALLLIMADPESGSTLMEVPKVLADAEFRNMKLNRCKDPTVVEFWRKEAEKAGGDAALANVVPYITSKLTSFISNDMMRPIIGQQNSSFNFREVMDKQKILLVSLPKGQIGEMNAYLLGMIIVGRILVSALSRTDMPKELRKDFYLYIDEFQNFTTDSISAILSEARKYGLNLIVAHQYIGQLVKNNDTQIKDAVFGNVGTIISFKIGSEDATPIEKEMAPVFNEFDLINIEAFNAYIKLLVDNSASRPFSMKTPWPLPGVRREDLASRIKTLSRLKYGQDRNIIEAEIFRRTQAEF
jgi:hypothetical protein